MSGTEIFRVWHAEPGAVYKLATAILDHLSAHVDPFVQVPSLMLVGNANVAGDAVGPLLGDELQRRRFSWPIVGTTKFPVLLRNVDEMQALLKYRAARLNREPYIIAIDAAVTSAPWFISVEERPLPIAGGATPEQREYATPRPVGRLSVLCGTTEAPDLLKYADTTLVLCLVRLVADAFMSVSERWDELVMTEYALTVAAGLDA